MRVRPGVSAERQPTPILRTDAADLATLAGARLAGITYHYLPPADGPGYAGGGDGVDADLTAVVLEFSNRARVTVTWAMAGELEGLSLLGEDAPYSGIADAVLDTGDSDAWRAHRGDAITAVSAAWHISGDDPRESLLAVHLRFRAGSVVIALGTADPDLAYMPDELVVVFDPSLAAAYRPHHASRSALGDGILDV